jgi:hypothetical protein
MYKKYDVALSYASEDRHYVKEVAEILRFSGIKVFYDEFEEATLWGKNLYSYLRSVYSEQALYTIMFCSENYARKLWTNHERESAQERAFRENSEYILPTRFDDTRIPGLLATVAYIDLRKKTPYELCELIGDKLHKKIAKKENLNLPLHEAVNKIIEEENSLTIEERENRNKHWDAFQSYMENLDEESLLRHQQKNSLFYLDKYDLSVAEIKRKLNYLGYYNGELNNEFTRDFAKAIESFQKLNNMRHIDGMIGELTLKELETRVNDKRTRKQ